MSVDSPEIGTFGFCDRCGQGLRPQARFCGACGSAVSSLETGHAQMGIQRVADTSQVEEGTSSVGMSPGKAGLVYLAAMGLLWMAFKFEWPTFGVIVYMVSGVVMTKLMGRLVEFHPMHNTLGNVVSQKLWMLLLWPIRMPILLFQLALNSTL